MRKKGGKKTQLPSTGKITTDTIPRPFHLPVEIIEEGEQIKAQLTPGLLLAVVEDVGIHHAHGVVHDLGAVGRPVEKPEKGEQLSWHLTEACGTSAVGPHLHRW